MMAVDDGEGRPLHYKATPILRADDAADLHRVAALFERVNSHVPGEIVDFVNAKLA